MLNENNKLGNGTWISIGAPVVTEIVSMLGFDWLLFDMEHGNINDSSLLSNIHAVRGESVKIIVRVLEPSPAIIGHILDLGVSGIMVPHVNSAEEALKICMAMQYPPKGNRGFSTSVRCFDYGLSPLNDIHSYKKPLFLAQIESFEGVNASSEIAAVEGVDMLFVGPRDLSLDLSVRGSETIDFDEALKRVAYSAASHGKQSGILVRNLEDADKLRSYGYSTLAYGSDLSALKDGYKKILSNLK